MNKGISTKLFTAILAAALTLVALELTVRARRSAELRTRDVQAGQLFERLPQMRVSGRELDHQMLVQNAALFHQHPDPASVTRAYVGTSRTKVLRPLWMGEAGSVNASGNSYNEISYGVILQAALLKRQFPNLDVLFVEASLLMRKADRLGVEEDHRKYLPLLREIIPLRAGISREAGPGPVDWTVAMRELEDGGQAWRKPLIVGVRGDLRITNLLMPAAPRGNVPVLEDPFLATLLPNGERRTLPAEPAPDRPRIADVTQDNFKVQRLRDIPAGYPWDGLFDVLALWAQKNNVRLVLFQPPVRADLFRFQQSHGLDLHVRDLERVARTYRVPFIDLNRPELGYSQADILFSDEDHLETCAGVVLFQQALWRGADLALKQGQLLPRVPQADIGKQGLMRECRPTTVR